MSFGIWNIISVISESALVCKLSEEPQVEDQILVQTSDLPACLAGRREPSRTLAIVKHTRCGACETLEVK